jgi:hypothetical protein
VDLRRLAAEFSGRPGSWSALLQVGDKYAKGSFPAFRPDPGLADAVFRVAAMCPDAGVAYVAQAKRMELYEEPMAGEDRAGRELPTCYAARVIEEGMRRIESTPFGSFAKPSGPARGCGGDDAVVVVAARAVRPRVDTGRPLRRAGGDAQNVHDHGVMAHVRSTLGALRRRVPGGGLGREDDVCGVVRAASDECPDLDDDARGRLEEVLRTVDRAVERHSTLGVSEREALALVWSRIGELEDPAVRAGAVETLAKQLASAVEGGSVVCSTGKISRMVGALDGIDAEAGVAKPLWAVREELGTLASAVRARVLASAPPEAAAGYESGSPRGAGEGLAAEMAARFDAEARATYVDALGMRPAVVAPLVSEFSAGF